MSFISKIKHKTIDKSVDFTKDKVVDKAKDVVEDSGKSIFDTIKENPGKAIGTVVGAIFGVPMVGSAIGGATDSVIDNKDALGDLLSGDISSVLSQGNTSGLANIGSILSGQNGKNIDTSSVLNIAKGCFGGGDDSKSSILSWLISIFSGSKDSSDNSDISKAVIDAAPAIISALG